jgi:hypothetical protein
MRHSHQDAIDTAARRAKQRGPNWHPLLALEEQTAGHWHMIDSEQRCYGVITIIRRGSEVGYRATNWVDDETERDLIGYFRTLKGAAEATHQHFIRSHAPGHHPKGLGG